MALPVTLDLIPITGRWVDLGGNPVQGSIEFSTTTRVWDTESQVEILPVPLTVDLVNGEIPEGFALPATNDPDIQGGPFTYRVVFNLVGTVRNTVIIEIPHNAVSVSLVGIGTVQPAIPATDVTAASIGAEPRISRASASTGYVATLQPDGSTHFAPAPGTAEAQFNWRGAWSNSLTYSARDAVSYAGSSWIAVGSSTSVPPAEGSAMWNLLAKKGDKGDPGTPGTNGTNGTNGATGAQGAQGPAGLSAYQIWLAAGNSGTETQFLASLKGPKGDPGTGTGTGVPPGGTAGQVLTKNSNLEGDAGWQTPESGDWAPSDHDHDTLYYTKQQVSTMITDATSGLANQITTLTNEINALKARTQVHILNVGESVGSRTGVILRRQS